MIKLDIHELYTLDKDDLLLIFNKYEKDELIEFAGKQDIPVKTYHSKNKIANHLAVQVASTGMYRRISRVDPERKSK